MNTKITRRLKRKRKIRQKIQGTKERPRLSIFRSNKHIYAQLIDDQAGKTLLAVSEKEINQQGKKSEKAFAVGKLLAQKT